jgi:hypothetical protein
LFMHFLGASRDGLVTRRVDLDTISSSDGHLDHFQKPPLTQNRETMALRTITTVNFFYFITCEDPHEHKSIEIAFS